MSLRKKATNTLTEEGIVSFLRKGIEYIASGFRTRVVGRIGDTLVRQLVGDFRTLPKRNRRIPDYLDSVRHGVSLYSWMRSDTEINLNENSTVADIGCGDGAVAIEFDRRYSELDYHGIDVNREWIERLAGRFSDSPYEFIHADIRNDLYNPNGEIQPTEFEFPFEDDSLDLILLHSVFTHMRQESVQWYLNEISRSLNPDGTAWITVFLLQDDADRYPENDRFQFEYAHDGFYATHQHEPERAIAYTEKALEEMCDQAGLRIRRRSLGTWRQTAGENEQDSLVIEGAR